MENEGESDFASVDEVFTVKPEEVGFGAIPQEEGGAARDGVEGSAAYRLVIDGESFVAFVGAKGSDMQEGTVYELEVGEVVQGAQSLLDGSAAEGELRSGACLFFHELRPGSLGYGQVIGGQDSEGGESLCAVHSSILMERQGGCLTHLVAPW